MAWNYFNANSELVNSLYSFTAPTRDVNDVVSGRRQLNYGFWNWLFCCCGAEKRDLYGDAVDAKDKELDVVNLTKSWRTARFLCDVQNDPKFCRLVKYSYDYKISPSEGDPLPT